MAALYETPPCWLEWLCFVWCLPFYSKKKTLAISQVVLFCTRRTIPSVGHPNDLLNGFKGVSVALFFLNITDPIISTQLERRYSLSSCGGYAEAVKLLIQIHRRKTRYASNDIAIKYHKECLLQAKHCFYFIIIVLY